MSYIPDRILDNVEKPSRYTGGEWNSIIKDKNKVDIRVAFCFADIYDIGMSHLGMKIIYHLLNERDDTWCERVFAPWPDLEKEMRDKGYKLFALESQEAIDHHDIIAFTLQYEMSFTNVINMIDLAGVPVFAKDRTEGMPFVLGGGPTALNPEPMADFFDLYNVFDGEEVLPELLDCYSAWKKSGKPRVEFLKEAAKIEGIYVPSFYESTYDEDGNFAGLIVKPEFEGIAKSRIQKRIVRDFEHTYYPDKQVVPFSSAVHDRIMLELFRGCIRGCRFCQAGFIYRPVRERSPERLMEIAKKLIDSTGYDEISLLSLSTSDYTALPCFTDQLLELTEQKNMNFGLPSLRIDSFSLDLMEKASKVRKSGLTFAVEAGTQRLRDVINKGVTEENLLSSCKLAFEGGWSTVKLYFMIGLPTETDEDLIGITTLAKKILDLFYEVNRGKKGKKPVITVSASTFVPKPFTPFQWCKQIDKDEIERRQKLIRSNIDRRISFSYHDSATSSLENVLARGDRRVGSVVYKVWKESGGFDAWNEFLNYDAWVKALDEVGICTYSGDREPKPDTPFAWDIMDIGVTKEFLWNEYLKAHDAVITENCRAKCNLCGCQRYKCGVCIERRS